MTFEEMQQDFIRVRFAVPSLPIAGILVYAGIALASLATPPSYRNLVLFVGFWFIMPVGAAIMRLRGEENGPFPENPLFELSALARVMVLATWSIHIPVWVYAPDLFPLTVGIAFALHWVVSGWSRGTSIGLTHLAMRIALVLVAWHAVPSNRVGAVSAAVAVSYLISVLQFRFSAASSGLPAKTAPDGRS
ncbi:DUF7010 family protein [Sphingomonas sp.]|jgi:hypothetical protein|uniref:DUF7010 family protein n=1 Tax=Sphingomonas sp. TaxID=28214 RepID=UPI002DF44F24|nr:hypothetical protein [Sphingomonas sp.]